MIAAAPRTVFLYVYADKRNPVPVTNHSNGETGLGFTLDPLQAANLLLQFLFRADVPAVPLGFQ